MKVEIAAQVADYIRLSPPDLRRRLRLALRALQDEKGDLKALDGELEGFCRLRVGSHRVIFHYETVNHHRIILCDFAEGRGLIYEKFSQLLSS